MQPKNSPGNINPKTVRYGRETISFLAPKIWAIVPQNIKNCTSLSSFKINIRKWKPDCPCRLRKCIYYMLDLYRNYQSNKNLQNIRAVTLLFFVSLSLTYFGPIFSGGLEISGFWGAYRNQSIYCAYRIK